MARSWRSAARDPWASTDMVDALRVIRAARHEAAGIVRPGTLAETTAQLMLRLGFDSIDEMRAWAEQTCDRRLAQAEAQRRQQEQAWLGRLDWPT